MPAMQLLFDRHRRRALCRLRAAHIVVAAASLAAALLLLPLATLLFRQGHFPTLRFAQSGPGFAAWRERFIGPALPVCTKTGSNERMDASPRPWSLELQQFLDAYASRHAAALAAQPDGAALAFVCGASHGGLGDRTKGMLATLLLAMLSSPPRAFLLDCDVNVPLTHAWVPATDSIQWLPSADVRHSMAAWSRVYAMNFIQDAVAAAAAVRDEQEHAARPPRTIVHSNLLVRDAFVSAALPGMRGEWYGRPLPPELAGLLRLADGVDDSTACKSVAPGVQPGHGIGATNTNVLFQLLDWWVAPSTPMQARLASLAAQYDPGKEYVIAVHVRVGTPPPGATYTDPERDDVVAAPALAARCADAAVSRLTQLYGARPRVLWFVASDHPAAHVAMRSHAAARGPHVRVLSQSDAAMAHSVLHIDKINATAMSQEDIASGFLDVYTEHFLLSAAHGMVRSSSGFSVTAQAWGRMRVAYELKAGGDGGTCVDVTNFAAQSVGICPDGHAFSLASERCMPT